MLSRSHSEVKKYANNNDELSKSCEYPIDHYRKKSIYPSLLNINNPSFTVPKIETSVYSRELRDISSVEPTYKGSIEFDTHEITPQSNFLAIVEFLPTNCENVMLHVIIMNYTQYIFNLVLEKYPGLNITIWGSKSVKESSRLKLGRGFPVNDDRYTNLLFVHSARMANEEMITYQEEVMNSIKPVSASLLFLPEDGMVKGKIVAQIYAYQLRLIYDGLDRIVENIEQKYLHYEAITRTTWPWVIEGNEIMMCFDECAVYDILMSSFNLNLEQAITMWKETEDRINSSVYKPKLPK